MIGIHHFSDRPPVPEAVEQLGEGIDLIVVTAVREGRHLAPELRELGRVLRQGLDGLEFYFDPSGDFWADYNGERDADKPGDLVFQRESDGTIRLFYAAEGGGRIADPGQDPHNAPDMNPLWILLDTTPGGRGTDWHPKLDD